MGEYTKGIGNKGLRHQNMDKYERQTYAPAFQTVPSTSTGADYTFCLNYVPAAVPTGNALTIPSKTKGARITNTYSVPIYLCRIDSETIPTLATLETLRTNSTPPVGAFQIGAGDTEEFELTDGDYFGFFFGKSVNITTGWATVVDKAIVSFWF